MKRCLIEICNIKINNGIYLFVFEIDVTQRADAGCYFIKKYSIVFFLNSKKVMKHPTSETVTIDWYIQKKDFSNHIFNKSIFFQAIPFMILNTLEKEYLKVGDIKKNYGGIVLSTCFSLGYLMIYQLGYEAVFFNAVMIPAAFITLHASVRTRKNIRVRF